jgi:DNA polymerase elongation subunit (family B)
MTIIVEKRGIKRIEELEELIILNRKKYKGKKIKVNSDYMKLEYSIIVYSEEENKTEIKVPVFLEIDVVYGDTDSVMCRFKYNRDDKSMNRHDTFRLSRKAGGILTEEIFNRDPIELEFEKVFNPFLLKGKKNYVGKMYDNLKDPNKLTKIHKAGVASTRRNYCEYYKRYAEEIYDCFLEEHMDDIIPITKRYIKDIVDYNVNIKDLTISSSLAAKYKTNNMPHLTVVEKLKERKQDVQVGDRIPYVFIEVQDKKAQKYKKAEDPSYVENNKIRFNRGVYLEHIAKPILGFMVPLLREHQLILDTVFSLFNEALLNAGDKKLPIALLKIK